MNRAVLIFAAAVVTGLLLKVGFEAYRYRQWDGIEQELDEWREVDRLGENPSYEG